MEHAPVIVLVDAYWPSRRLAPAFRRAGCQCVRVQSTPEVPAFYRNSPAPPEDFVADIVHHGDVAATIEAVARLRPTAVLAAGESGVEFADLLSESLGILSNGTKMSAARRDKHAMIEAVRAAGLDCARQMLIPGEEALRRWHRDLGGKVVLKPIRNAGSVGVHFCDTPEESVRAYRSLREADSIFSEPCMGVVAQEYLAGPEYIIDTASRDGLHHVCDIWRSTKISLNGVSDLLDGLYLMGREGEVQEQIVDYSYKVLDALEIRHGLAHIEVKMTPRGPCLVEIGARIAGGDLPHYAQLAIGESQLDWAADAYARPDVFRSRYRESYRLRQYFACVPMLSPCDGILVGYRGLEEIKRLESFREVLQAVSPGGRLTRTVDDLTIPLAVNLMHEIEEVVYRDSRTVRFFDGPGFYDVALDGDG